MGLGSGVTCGAVLRHESVKRLDVVEISPEVVEAAQFFQQVNDEVLNNGRLHLTVEDAKSFLKLTEREYDILAVNRPILGCPAFPKFFPRTIMKTAAAS